MRLSAPARSRVLRPISLARFVLAAVTRAAQTQSPRMHGVTRGPAPIQQSAAWVTREAVTLGGIVVTAVPVVDGVAARFERKRKPSAPLPLAVGDRAIVLLRGARSPDLVVDSRDHMIRAADDTAAGRCSATIRAVATAQGDPAKPLPLDLSWGESGLLGLRGEALRASL